MADQWGSPAGDAAGSTPSAGTTSTGRGSAVPAKLVAFAVVAAIAVVFVLQNRERTEIDFLVFELRSRTWAAIVTAMVLGIVLDRLFLNWWRKRRESR